MYAHTYIYHLVCTDVRLLWKIIIEFMMNTIPNINVTTLRLVNLIGYSSTHIHRNKERKNIFFCQDCNGIHLET